MAQSSSFPALPARAGTAAGAAARADESDDPVTRARAGDMRAWSLLYNRHFDRIFRRLCFFVGDAAVAEDLTQETFARAVIGLPSFDGRAAFSTWLFGIALNVARNFVRDRDTQRRAEQRLADVEALRPGDDGDRTQLRRAWTEALYAALAELPDGLREAFVMREIEGLSMADAAARAGVSANNMAVRVHRAREKVRQVLTRVGWLPATREEAGP
jgi:RNA polymerase sigma-70 factor (ECF subfamily)